MSTTEQYRPVHTVCINPDKFPQINLYMRAGNTNMVLYIPSDRKITQADLQRLKKNQVDQLYIGSCDSKDVSDFFEDTIGDLMDDESIPGDIKGQLLSQVSINYLIDIFEMPDKLSNQDRCKNLIKRLIQFVTNNKDCFDALNTVVSHDFYTFAHSVHVASLSLLVHAEIFCLTPSELEDVGIGSLLHDVGMIFVPQQILEKNDILTHFEYGLIKKHAERGYECLRDMGGFSEISLAAVRYHHERFNGEGYPFQMSGNNIPRTAQVLAICDVFSALTSNRTYKKAITKEEALKLMSEVSEDHKTIFNPWILEQFKKLVLPTLPTSIDEKILQFS